MSKPPLHTDRRQFISKTFKLALLAGMLPLSQSCGNNTETNTKGADSTATKKNKPVSNRKPRKKWHHEGIVVNSKTKVMHFPTSKVYVYYDEIKAKNLQSVALAAWSTQLVEPVHLNKEQSGNILEILSLQQLQKGVNDQSLTEATNVLAKAFSKECENKAGKNPNSMSFRIHELMLQLVSLNNAIPANAKWTEFNNRVTKPAQLRKRQKWMETESAFNDRVKYITDRTNDYKTRLTQRAMKYNFT